MAYRTPLSKVAYWSAWVVAGGVGYALPYQAIASGVFGPTYAVRDSWIVIAVGSAMIAFPQYIVLRLVIGHSSLAGAMWIPVTAAAWLATYLAIYPSAERITDALLSLSAIQALTPGPVPFITVISGVQDFSFAAVVGLTQGLLLARVFVARSACWLWLLGNLVAAVVLLIGTQLQLNGVPIYTNQAAADAAIPGALTAAVTGIVLVSLPRRDRRAAAPVTD